LVIFGLYLTGICVALATGFFLQRTLLPGNRAPLVMELPPYRWPRLKTLFRSTYFRVNRFVLKAGALILPLCAVIGLAGAYKTDSDTSRFAYWGKMITPIFAPMGITEENWPATVGLLTGVVAKEVVVGTLNALYLQEAMGETAEKNANINTDVKDASKLERQTPDILGVMSQRFESMAAAVAYLLFVLLYFPCVSVIAVIGRELNKSWAAFTVIWTTGVAYSVSVIFYQVAMIQTETLTSLCSISLIIGIGFGFFKALKFYIIRKAKPVNSKYKPLPTQVLIVK
jgi:ferrous iron transport protein B